MVIGKSNKWGWILGGAILVAGGIGAYFLLRKKGDEEETKLATDDIKEQEAKEIGSVEPIVAPSELDSSEKIKAFQDWLDKYRPLWVNDNGTYKNLSVGTASEPNRNVAGKGYGTYGKNTNTAWKTFGNEYIESLKKVSITVDPRQDVSKDIQTIINKSTGSKAEKSYLKSANPKFVNTWAKTLRKNREKYFVFANQIYSTTKGDRILDFNPIGKRLYSTLDKLSLFQNASLDSGAISVSNIKDAMLTKVEALKYNPNDETLWAYIPNNKYSTQNKWFAVKYLTDKKPNSSSFDGVKFEPMSSMDSFDITM
jgi:hypothetical protein